MSKVYRCDACMKVITHPHVEKMKEFYLGVDYTEYGILPYDKKRKIKVHLCDDCFKGLRKIGQDVKKNLED